jgi:hypothetical protein
LILPAVASASGAPGWRGKWITIYANDEHVLNIVDGERSLARGHRPLARRSG